MNKPERQAASGTSTTPSPGLLSPDRQAPALAEDHVVGGRVGDPVLLLRDAAAALLVQLGRQGRCASGYTIRARAEATIGTFKQVVGDGLRSRPDKHRATEVNVAVHVLNRMLDLGRLNSVRVA